LALTAQPEAGALLDRLASRACALIDLIDAVYFR